MNADDKIIQDDFDKGIKTIIQLVQEIEEKAM